jgi:probable F420-dependent oxidoreductase
MIELPLFAQNMFVSGYTDFWTSESDFADGLTPLAAIAAHVPNAHLGVAILPVQTRGPALLAMSVASLANIAPGRLSVGLGASTPTIVHDWNDRSFSNPLTHVREMLEFLQLAFTGERIDKRYSTFAVSGFRLRNVPPLQPKLLVGALRPQMLALGASVNGAITNWLSAEDVTQVRGILGDEAELVARIMVCPSEDSKAVRTYARKLIAAYLNVPAYKAFQMWLGRGPALQHMWDSWESGDRKNALAAIPNEVIDALIVHGSPDHCRLKIKNYRDNGVSVPVIYLLPIGMDLATAARALAPLDRDETESRHS